MNKIEKVNLTILRILLSSNEFIKFILFTFIRYLYFIKHYENHFWIWIFPHKENLCKA